MATEMPIQTPSPVEDPLREYQLERYWALWQAPESRYAYMIGFQLEGWLIVMDSEEAGLAYLRSDARQNRRTIEQYRLDELTIPEAFAAVRVQPLPFISSHGIPVLSVRGVQVRTMGAFGTRVIRNVPM